MSVFFSLVNLDFIYYLICFFNKLPFYTFIILSVFIIFSLLVQVILSTNFFFTKLLNIIKFLFLMLLLSLTSLFLARFFFFYFFNNSLHLFLVNQKISQVYLDNICTFTQTFSLSCNITLFGSALLVLGFFSSFISLIYLGDRKLISNLNNSVFFCYFLICTLFLTNTHNLLVMLLSFECIFFPSLYFVYTYGYAKRVDISIKILFIWTALGALLMLFISLYLWVTYNTLDFFSLKNCSFTIYEKYFIYISFFLGLGIKIPIFPFYYWLTKVHVEAPAGFSMFLSGFLVKTAFYFLYFIYTIFNVYVINLFFIIWILFCIGEVSIKMWVQVDFKKLIALATVQEMNLMLLFLFLLNPIHLKFLSIFMVLHGLLSALMFFCVDLIQVRTQTRNIYLLSGVGTKFNFLRLFCWTILLFYFGFPLTTKFIIEWYIGSYLLLYFTWVGLIIFFILIVIGNIGFFKIMLIILYGTPHKEAPMILSTDLTKVELWTWFFFLSMLLLLMLVFYIC